jgi:arsenite/tail-anchored protein-transporting ATPase
MWADRLTRSQYLFFTGKGGVGKTSLACATALHLAESGKRTLLVSTDPASNLDEVLGVALGAEPTLVPATTNLWAANLDPEEAARAYREKAVAPYRGILPDAALASIEEQFSGACTIEIAAFNEFVRLFGGEEVAAAFDAIVFDTAPTGHTLRLLSLPAAWSGFIDTSKGGMSCVGPLAQLQQQAALYRASLAALRDAERTTVVLVARPDKASLKEAARASGELSELGVANQQLIVNGVFSAPESTDAVAVAFAQRTQAALAALPGALSQLPLAQVPLLPRTVVGLAAIRQLLAPDATVLPEPTNSISTFVPQPLEPLIAQVAAQGHGVVMTMGKGGVGKTSLAAQIALRLAHLGHAVTLSTTDPAAHIADAVAGSTESLILERIDPAVELESYRAEVMGAADAELDDAGRALLEEDLRSPCTEEIAVFRAFARTVAEGKDRFVVLDTAPTGHTILLLDAAEAYHREVLRTQNETPESVRELLPRLRDPRFTFIFVVTLPEPTPIHEAQRLQEDLRRAQIEPFAWVVNQSFLASGTQDALLSAKAAQEIPLLKEVAHLSERYAVLPWSAP